MNKCKHCGFELKGQDIYNSLRKRYPEEPESKILEWAKNYGWSEENKITFDHMIGVEYIDIADGVAYYICPKCEKIVQKGTYWHKYKARMKKQGKEVQDP